MTPGARGRNAPSESAQEPERAKAIRVWAPAESSQALTAEPIPAERLKARKKEPCTLPMIRREGLSEHSLRAARIPSLDPRTGGAMPISTEAIRGHSAGRLRVRLDWDDRRDARRGHRENRDRRRDEGGYRADFRNAADGLRGARCAPKPHCPREPARLAHQPADRVQARVLQANTRSN